jgi:hypothetical protein
MNERYSHWLWNSKLANFIAQKAVRFSSWMWNKQYGNRS